MSKNFKNELLKVKREKQASHLIAVRLPDDVYQKLKALSKETKLSMSGIIIHSLKTSLEIGE